MWNDFGSLSCEVLRFQASLNFPYSSHDWMNWKTHLQRKGYSRFVQMWLNKMHWNGWDFASNFNLCSICLPGCDAWATSSPLLAELLLPRLFPPFPPSSRRNDMLLFVIVLSKSRFCGKQFGAKCRLKTAILWWTSCSRAMPACMIGIIVKWWHKVRS